MLIGIYNLDANKGEFAIHTIAELQTLKVFTCGL